MDLLVFLIPSAIRLFYLLCGASSVYFAVKAFKTSKYFAFGWWGIIAVGFIAKLIKVGV